MVATGYIIEQVVLGLISLYLFIAYGIQLKRDIYIENVVSLQTGVNTIVFERVKSLGYTAFIFHLGGVAGCFVLILRSIDPFPVLGIYPFVVTDLLSHIGIAFLLSTIFEGLGSMASKLYFKLNLPANENFLQKWIRVITYCTFSIAIITWTVENFISAKLVYSAGVYFIYGTLIQWIILLLYARMIQVFQLQLGDKPLLPQNVTMAKSIRKFKIVRNLFCLINVLLTVYQVYIFIMQAYNQSELDPINPDEYTPVAAPLYMTQVIGYIVLLGFSYVSKKKAGDAHGLSEVSTINLREHERAREREPGCQPGQPGRLVHTGVQEVVVKFKQHEIDPKMKVLDTEGLMHTTINRRMSDASEDSQILSNTYPTGTFRTEVSSDPSGPINSDEFKILMRLIEQQSEAEKEGRLEEFIAEQERAAKQSNMDSDYLVQQIYAMKERNRYESTISNSLPPSPPPFRMEEYTPPPPPSNST